MTLSDFRDRNSAVTVDLPLMTTGKHGKHTTTYRTVHGPFCSNDGYADFFPNSDPSKREDGVVTCDTGWKNPNRDDLVIAGVPVTSIFYHFFRDRLYEVDITFEYGEMRAIAPAFIEKYGAPQITKDGSRELDLGVVQFGTDYEWRKSGQTIMLFEGYVDQRGLGTAGNFGLALLRAPSLSPPLHKRAPVDF